MTRWKETDIKLVFREPSNPLLSLTAEVIIGKPKTVISHGFQSVWGGAERASRRRHKLMMGRKKELKQKGHLDT